MSKQSYGGNPKEGTNAQYALFMQDIMSMPKIDIYEDDSEALKAHCERYLELCAEYDVRPSLANFAQSLHISRIKLRSIAEGLGRPVPTTNMEQLQSMMQGLEATLEDGMLSGAANVVGSIFVAKNNFGYKDQTEQVIVHHSTQKLSVDELKALADSLPDVIDGEYTEIPESHQIGEDNE